MKVVNKANLPYRIVGYVIDEYIANNYEDTCYYGKIEYFEFIYKDKKYKAQIRYLKRYVEWIFCESN